MSFEKVIGNDCRCRRLDILLILSIISSGVVIVRMDGISMTILIIG